MRICEWRRRTSSAARHFSLQARAQRQPSASVNFDPSYQQLSAESYLHSGSLAPTGLYDTGVSVSYEIDLFGRLRRVIEAAKADDEAIKAAYDLTRINVAAETARAYAAVCNTGEQLAVARRSLQLQLRSAAGHAASARGGPSPDAGFHTLLGARRTAQGEHSIARGDSAATRSIASPR